MAMKKKKKRGRKIVAAVIVGLILVIIVGSAMGRNGDGVTIDTTKVRIGSVVEKLTETGNIELLRTVEVKSKIAGTVQEILVNEGDQVKAGEVLCVIDPDPTQTLLLFQKRSAVDRSRISLDQAEKEAERKRELAKTNLISQKEMEDADNNYLMAQNNYNLARQELEIMEREIETSGSGAEERIVASKVRAPYDGYITQRFVEIGTLVTSGMSSVVAGTTLFQIGDPSTMIIKTNISEVDIGKVEVGNQVEISLDAYPDTTFAGVIRHISPVGQLQQGRSVIAFETEVAIMDKDPRLRPGMSCDVDVILSSRDSVLYLPLEAVYKKVEGSEEDGDQTTSNVVYVKKQNAEAPAPKKKFGIFAEKPDPLANFEELKVDLGIKSLSRVQIIADVDTTFEVASDATQVYNDFEARRKAEEEKQQSDAGTPAQQEQS